MTMENLGNAQEALAESKTGGEPEGGMADAVACLEAALRVYDPVHTPYYHGPASASLARVRAKLRGIGLTRAGGCPT